MARIVAISRVGGRGGARRPHDHSRSRRRGGSVVASTYRSRAALGRRGDQAQSPSRAILPTSAVSIFGHWRGPVWDRIVRLYAMSLPRASASTSTQPASAPLKLRFDQGTILLTEPPHNLDLEAGPGVLWDPRVGAHRAPANRLSALRGWLREARIDFEDVAPSPQPAAGLWSPADLRPYQEAALSAWALAHRRGIVALPTGSGKTRLAIAAIRRTGLSALCLVPTRVLLDQWTRETGIGVHRRRRTLWRRSPARRPPHGGHVRERISAYGATGRPIRPRHRR